jgi:hypothetical protein
MPRIPRATKVTQAVNILRALETALPAHPKYTASGKRYTVHQLIAVYQTHLDTIAKVDAAKAALGAALRDERAAAARVKKLTVDLKAMVDTLLGRQAWTLFGWPLPKKTGPKTAASKAAGVRKRASKRAER